ncbi:MAG: hypothetical protein H7Y42_07685 [Chitinophagaceae bacterium]|nr:hypothetical protein [Chitinophagaceae bacterium]
MRFLVSFLLAIILASASTPCCIEESCASESIGSHEENGDDCEAGCSPFFTCSGCPGAVLVPRVMQVDRAVAFQPTYIESRKVNGLAVYYSSFWQPPRLG